MFLYYRRRRLRYYQGEEWPFPTLPANGRAGGRRKEVKDYGETPEMYECLLDVKTADADISTGDVWGGQTSGAYTPQAINDFTHWQPVTVKSLETKAIPAGTTSSHSAADNASGTHPSRPMSLFSRTLSTGRNMLTQGSLQAVTEPTDGFNATSEKPQFTYTSSNGTAQLPLSVTYLIAMPSAQRDTTERRPSAIELDDDEAGEEIPEVALGMTSVSLEIPGVSLATQGNTGNAAVETTPTKQRRRMKTGQSESVPETGTTNPVIGQDGALDLVALLQQRR